MQRKSVSLLEAVCNVGSGFIIALIVWEVLIEPIFGIEKNFRENLGITTIFTTISVTRSFLWRRLYNWFEGRKGGKHE